VVPSRTESVKALRHPVSSLALSDFGWMHIANFIVVGLLMLAFAIGLRRALRPVGGSTWGSLLVGSYAIGLLGAAAPACPKPIARSRARSSQVPAGARTRLHYEVYTKMCRRGRSSDTGSLPPQDSTFYVTVG
jgi:hypothetical protein